ncbi:MAG: hypothetical protein M1835_007128 [Candelina submexicana]|nr:MAG: hypothetical protein M1835_007128 [Candelina submexicana]
MPTQGALVPPPGVIADVDHPHDSLRTLNFVTQGLCMSFVTIFVVLRLYARFKLLHATGADDYACLIAWFLMMGYCGTGITMSIFGGGYHQWDVKADQIEPFFKTFYAAAIFYAPMAFFVKVALLTILTRVFAPYRRTLILIYIIIGLLLAYYIPALITKIRICMPISAYWRGEREKCLNQGAIIMSDSIISVISDLAILVLPLPLTWSLQMPRKKKMRVIGLLGAGGLATAFSVYRLALIVANGSSPDATILLIKVILSGNAEAGIGLICACLPATSALYTHHHASQSSSRLHEQGSQSLTAGQQLSSLRMTNMSGCPRRGGDKMETLYSDLELGSDQAVLVSHAQHEEAAEQREAQSDAQGIMKTVGVHYAVTYKDGKIAKGREQVGGGGGGGGGRLGEKIG